jgi:hypothetical protein
VSRPEPQPAASPPTRERRLLDRLDDSLLVHLLLAFVVLELAIFRLAVPTLLPPGSQKPPLWHQGLTWVGLYLFYFATVLAIAVLIRSLLIQRGDAHRAIVRHALRAVGAALLAAALYAQLRDGERPTFLLDATFTLAIAVLVIAQLWSRGDLGARVGLVLLATPLLIHFYGPLGSRLTEEIGLAEKVHIFGQWSMVFAALATPYCFAPRPFTLSVTRIPPLVLAMFVAVIGAIVVNRSYEVGMELASKGLGVDLGPASPTSMLALYIMALAAVTWTLVSCLSAEAPARRLIGAGLGLVLFAGYAFVWPLQYLLGFAGLLVISGASRRVQREEREPETIHGGASPSAAVAPPIDEETWRRYVEALAAALRSRIEADGGGEEEAAVSTATVGGDGQLQRTHVVWRGRGGPMRLTVSRAGGAVREIVLLAGAEPAAGETPSWTLHTRPSGYRAAGEGDGDDFDRRFHTRGDDAGAALLDGDLREEAVALIDGWIGYWPGRALRFRVSPGAGAPIDHPIPITELAVRGAGAPPRIDAMLRLIELIEAIAVRGLERRTR